MSTPPIADGNQARTIPYPVVSSWPQERAQAAHPASSAHPAQSTPPSSAAAPSAPTISPYRLQAEVLQAVLDTEIDDLIDKLQALSGTLDARSPQVQPAPSPVRLAAAVEPGLDRVISENFDAHLKSTRRCHRPDERARALHAAVALLPGLAPETRSAAREAIAASIAAEPDGAESGRILSRLLDDFITAHTGTAHPADANGAVAFTCTLSRASADLPFVSKCKLLVIQLWSAKRLNLPEMANASLKAFVQHVGDEDPEVTVRRLATAATYIDAMPVAFSPMAVMALYRCVPIGPPWELEALETLAMKDTTLAQTAEARDCFKTLHQRIYALRMRDAND